MASSISFDIIAKDRASSTFSKIAGASEKSHRSLAKFAVGFGAATAGGALFLAKVGGPYVASLNKIATLTDASNAQMKEVSRTLEGNSVQYAKMGQTVGDAAGGVVELTKAGLSLRSSLHAVNATMVLAKAGELGVAEASTLVANTLNTFGLKARRAGDIANYLANAANISSADVSDLAESFKYVAPVAASTGVSLKQTNAILAELSNSGIAASNAGTGFRKFLLSLQAPSGAAAKDLKELNVQIFDSAGKMKSLPEVIGTLSTAMNGLADQKRQKILKDIFGLQGVSAAQVILKNGTAGLAEYTKGVGKAGAAQRLANSASKGLMGTLGMLRAEVISLAQAVYRQISPAIDNVLRPFVAKLGELSTTAGPAIQKFINKLAPVAGKVQAAFSTINIGDIGSNLADQAKSWAAPIIAGFQAGLNTGDWSGLGKALGNGLVKALSGLGSLAGKVTDKLGSALGKIDWVGIGIDIGKQAPSLLIGLAVGLLNFDLLGLLKGLAAHWQDALLAVLAVAFTPGKIIGKVGELLARIPLVGKLLQWALLHFKSFSDGLVGMVGKALGFMGRAFLTGFRRVFPEVGQAFGAALRLFPTRIGVAALDVQAKALGMMRKLAGGIAKGIGAVAAKIGEVIATILKPWVDAHVWLFNKGIEIMRGLGSGIRSAAGAVLRFFGTIGGRIVGAVGDLGGVLFGAGKAVIQGLINGIGAMVGSLVSKLKSVTNLIPKHKGPESKDRKLLEPAGRAIMDGLIGGIEGKKVSLKKALAKVTDMVQAVGEKLSGLQDIKSGFLSTFQSDSIFGADLSGGGGIGALIAFEQNQASKASQLLADVQKVASMGLSKSLIAQLQSAGSSGADQLHALASGSAGQIAQLNALDVATSSSLQAAGMYAGNYGRGGSIDADISQASREEALLNRLVAKLEQLQHAEYVTVEIEGDQIVKAIKKRNHAKGVKSAGL